MGTLYPGAPALVRHPRPPNRNSGSLFGSPVVCCYFFRYASSANDGHFFSAKSGLNLVKRGKPFSRGTGTQSEPIEQIQLTVKVWERGERPDLDALETIAALTRQLQG